MSGSREVEPFVMVTEQVVTVIVTQRMEPAVVSIRCAGLPLDDRVPWSKSIPAPMTVRMTMQATAARRPRFISSLHLWMCGLTLGNTPRWPTDRLPGLCHNSHDLRHRSRWVLQLA